MEQRRFGTFIVLAMAVLIGNYFLMQWLNPPVKKPVVPKNDQPIAVVPDKQAKKPDAAQAKKPDAEGKRDEQASEIAPQHDELPLELLTLGSADPESPYRMLVTLTNRGAAVERIELNSPRYRDVENWEDRSGYLGHLDETNADGSGCLVRVVGTGTPAALAGLQSGDIIESFNTQPVKRASDYRIALGKTRPQQQATLGVKRDGKTKSLVATLGRRPLDVVRPEAADPLSFLMTINGIDGKAIAQGEEELPGVTMRTENWKVLPRETPDEVAFQWTLPDEKLEIVKRFRLLKIPSEKIKDANYPGYNLDLSIAIRNRGDKERNVAYRLDGPTGLPREGYWYSYKISPNFWGGAGLRDVVLNYVGSDSMRLVSPRTIADKPENFTWDDIAVTYIGVDAQYFSSMLIPQPEGKKPVVFHEAGTLRSGPIPEDASRKNQIDVSCRLVSEVKALEPGVGVLEHNFKIFAGPKKPALLAQYGLDELVYYGWFGFVSVPMLGILHFFHDYLWPHNYGIAIVLLTVLVRSCMFPISRKQALNAQKMQELKPEIDKLAAKYKGDAQAKGKATMELYRKYNISPLSGCLPMLLQLPIFMGLYRSLSVDVELRQAPLISEAVRWCSNLGAPDMAWYWEPFLPGFLASPYGYLGPYLNILPLITIGLFIWQQKMFMPPPTDDQSAMQQKMMQYMMIFMGVMFFKVASGLCLYFIASSMWGIAERKLLPKNALAAKPSTFRAPPAASSNGARDANRKKQQRGKK
jgi:YidC/Oxa1 family membrane protein insertase